VSSDGTALPEAAGPNANPFFKTPAIQAPIVSPAANLNEVALAPTLLFDLATEPGGTYLLLGE
jgi:alpha-L-fucosidase 2